MLVRIQGKVRKEEIERAALAIGALLTPCALGAFTMAFWSIAAGLRWTGKFVIASGLLSHWEVWLMAAALLLIASRLLSRYADHRESSDTRSRQADFQQL